MDKPIRLPREIKDLDMRIAANGDWFYRGSIIARPALVKLFASVLRIEEDGRHFLQTPVERGEVIVELAPFIATLMSVEGEGREQRLTFTTNVEDEVLAGAEHPMTFSLSKTTAEPVPLVEVRDGLMALMARPVFYQLVDLAVENETTGKLEVWSDGQAFSLAGLEPANTP